MPETRKTLKQAVHELEARMISEALAETGGHIERAAYLLGFKHHQSLCSIINNRHQELRTSPLRKRKQRPRGDDGGKWNREAL